MTTPTDNEALREEIVKILGLETAPDGQRDCLLTRDENGTVLEGTNYTQEVVMLVALFARRTQTLRKQTASDIFKLAHQYAREDKTMIGSENLRAYHYYNAIAKIGDFDGR